ncbi:MAG: bifunctional folylpolyglutamate synthase/dihydrofolate synthase [candidate division KSB1 bacterium]|nr:bifunctional folylpolyglutamate synthase/dihydrofolate synthase [candidate division KSB1 bacterium]MDZ7365992.1 bifunctional folylpolyglutamate synthase/dihydrofolate synthase [candidate division KSB1 bacterium]MDZ7404109.1 bifunctional folylpolyglutamate synthase/dihydrofolate synthase [candidate division KSB1 bacterium]
MTAASLAQPSLTADSQRFLDSLGFFGWQLGLERIEKLCEFFGQPQLKYPAVHIAGTNGKGSTAAMLAAIGKAAGLRTGLYTSPHLVHLNERIQIDGVPVPFAEIEAALQSCRPLAESLQATYFEVITAIAFEIFAQRQVELAIIETGLGGRLDATNVVQPEVTVITSIGLEHQKYLGRTLAQIAGEKAGIIKKGVPCISGVRQKTARQPILKRCHELRAPLYELQDQAKIKEVFNHPDGLQFTLDLPNFNLNLNNIACALRGRHQVNNAASAVFAAALLRKKYFQLTDDALRRGLQTVFWPARLQLIQTQPAIVADAAHNAAGMRVLVQNLQEIFKYRRLLVVMGLLDDKPLPPILRAWKNLRPHFFLATPPTTRGRPAIELVQAAKKLGLQAEAFDSPATAFAQARENSRKDDLLCMTGSHYLIGALMKEGCIPLPYSN